MELETALQYNYLGVTSSRSWVFLNNTELG